MKNNQLPLYLIGFFMTFPMVLSKAVHPVLAEQKESLLMFGIFYSTMAFFGVFSFLYIRAVDRIGMRLSIFIGFTLYGLSMLCRVHVESLIYSVMSGAFGGVGASIILLSTRCMISNISESGRPRVLKNKKIFESIATFMVSISLFLFGYIYIDSGKNLSEMLLLCALFSFAAGGWLLLFFKGEKANIEVNNDLSALSEIKRNLNSLTVAFLFFNLLCGAYISLSSPFVFVILMKFNDSEGVKNLSLYLIIMSLTSFFAYQVGGKLKEKFSAHNLFLITESAFLIFNLSLYWISGSEALVLLACVARYITLLLSAYYQELMEYSIVDTVSNKGFILSVGVSSFLLGDMIGGLLAGFVGGIYGVSSVFILSSLLILINAIGFYIFYISSKNNARRCGTVYD